MTNGNLNSEISNLWITCCLITTCLCGNVLGQESSVQPIEYTVILDAPQTQMVDVTMSVLNITGDSIHFALPTWRPGRYSILDPAETVREVRALDMNGQLLSLRKIEKSQWHVETNGASGIQLKYRIYANSLADRTRHVDDTHAFLSGSSVFMYVPDRRNDPVRVQIRAPADWKIASGMKVAEDDPRTLVAPNYDVLVDSPIEVGIHDSIFFEAAGKPHAIVIWGDAHYDPEQLKSDFAEIVEEQTEIFSGAPYDYYVFITHIGPSLGGGTEHLNSTVIQATPKRIEDPKEYKKFLGLVSHEMFHTWNVKSFRPAGIHPYDYQKENYSNSFWIAEGTTSYYDDLTLVRTGLITPKRYLEIVGDAIDDLRNRPGAKVQSLEESSFDAWIKFNKRCADDVNSEVSFYSKGALVNLIFDLEIRKRTNHQRSLDNVMRVMFDRFPLSGPGFTDKDFQDVVEEVAGSQLDDLFAKYVRGTDPLEYDELLNMVGLELYLKPEQSDEEENDGGDDRSATQPETEISMKAYLGMELRDDHGRSIVRSVRSDGPAYQAGIIAGDELLSINGRRVAADAIADRMKQFDPGNEIELAIFRDDKLRTIKVELASRPDAKWTLRKIDEPTEQQKAAYMSWLGQPWSSESSNE